jgi:class 3 adenylate cyclase
MLAFPSAAYGLRSCIVTRNRLSEGYCGLPIRVRAGLHAGEALRHENDFYGRTVVIAARISALALGNEILASELVHTLAIDVGTFTFGERSPGVNSPASLRVVPVAATALRSDGGYVSGPLHCTIRMTPDPDDPLRRL